MASKACLFYCSAEVRKLVRPSVDGILESDNHAANRSGRPQKHLRENREKTDTHTVEVLESLDRNQDGQVVFDEYSVKPKPATYKLFDFDLNGQLSLEELVWAR